MSDDATRSDHDAAVDRAVGARRAAWGGIGRIDDTVLAHAINPAFLGGPRWPAFRQAFVHVELPDGRRLVATDGLSDPWEDDPAGTGLGAELVLVHDDVPADVAAVADSWVFQLLYQAAQNLVFQGSGFVAGIERYGALSMSIPGAIAPQSWTDVDEVGVLLGVRLPGLPGGMTLPSGEIRLLSVLPLRDDELEEILDGGATARREIAARLERLDAAGLASGTRRSVLLD